MIKKPKQKNGRDRKSVKRNLRLHVLRQEAVKKAAVDGHVLVITADNLAIANKTVKFGYYRRMPKTFFVRNRVFI